MWKVTQQTKPVTVTTGDSGYNCTRVVCALWHTEW